MDYIGMIHSIIDPIITKPEAVLIREQPSENEKDVTFIIVSENEDTARLIGKKGAVANAIRNIVSIAGKIENKHVHLKFESFDQENK